MRSLIIIEVEHGEDTDALQQFAENQVTQAEYWDCTVLNYAVRVDIPTDLSTVSVNGVIDRGMRLFG